MVLMCQPIFDAVDSIKKDLQDKLVSVFSVDFIKIKSTFFYFKNYVNLY